jgi:hypothetical protein
VEFPLAMKKLNRLLSFTWFQSSPAGYPVLYRCCGCLPLPPLLWKPRRLFEPPAPLRRLSGICAQTSNVNAAYLHRSSSTATLEAKWPKIRSRVGPSPGEKDIQILRARDH